MNQEINQTTPPRSTMNRYDVNQLFRNFIELFKSPVFDDDPEKTRVAGVLYPIMISFFLGLSVIPISALVINPAESLISIVIGLIFLVPILFALIMVKRGYVRRTATIFVVILFVLLVVMAGLFGQSENNPVFPGLLTVIYLAGILLGTRMAAVFGFLTWAEIMGLYLIDQYVDLPVVLESDPGTYFQSITITVILMAFYVFFGTRSYGKAFRQATEAEESLKETNEELEGIRTYLEGEVARNTLQLERRTRYLEAGAKVANASISTQNLQGMLDRVANEITAQFGFYHTGIFLLDEQKEWAALRATSSEGGRRMIARNHRLAVGAQGIVGFVTSLGKARISQDTGEDRVHEPAPELPNTRSEMALPLISRNEIIGALDIQDTRPEAFTQEDITVLQTMADQIALAIENIRLYSQTQETLEEVQRMFGDFSQQAWQNVHKKNMLTSYRYFGGTVSEINPNLVTEMTENTVSIPVEVRGVKLGAIEISKGEEGSSWSDEEMKLLTALAEQMGIALDSARLFNESQLRATTEHAISEINSQLWETMDINAILRTTAQNLRETLALPELTIRMASIEDDIEASPNGTPESDEIEMNN
ncbi:MAG: GAF domain-containing protein [Anaerolineales bacterium]